MLTAASVLSAHFTTVNSRRLMPNRNAKTGEKLPDPSGVLDQHAQYKLTQHGIQTQAI